MIFHWNKITSDDLHRNICQYSVSQFDRIRLEQSFLLEGMKKGVLEGLRLSLLQIYTLCLLNSFIDFQKVHIHQQFIKYG